MRRPCLTATHKPSNCASHATAGTRIWLVGFALSVMAAGCQKDTPSEQIEPYSYCGDGVHDANEQCDDGNRIDFDGCSECQFDRKGPGELLWVDENYQGSGLTIGPNGLLYIQLNVREANGKVNPGVACIDPRSRAEKWRTYAYKEGKDVEGLDKTIGLVDGLVYHYNSEVHFFDLSNGDLVRSVGALLHPTNYLSPSLTGYASDGNENLYYSSASSIVRLDVADGGQHDINHNPVRNLPGMLMDGEKGMWIDEWKDDYIYQGITHLNLENGNVAHAINMDVSDPPNGILALMGTNSIVYRRQHGDENDNQGICWARHDSIKPIEDGCVSYTGAGAMWLVIGKGGVIALHHLRSHPGGEEQIVIIDQNTKRIIDEIECVYCGWSSLRVSDDNKIFWVDGNQLVCYDPTIASILWEAPLPEGPFNDMVLAPDGIFYILKSGRLMAVRGDGFGLCRDCPWPAPDHDQQRTKRFGAELVEYLRPGNKATASRGANRATSD